MFSLVCGRYKRSAKCIQPFKRKLTPTAVSIKKKVTSGLFSPHGVLCSQCERSSERKQNKREREKRTIIDKICTYCYKTVVLSRLLLPHLPMALLAQYRSSNNGTAILLPHAISSHLHGRRSCEEDSGQMTVSCLDQSYGEVSQVLHLSKPI